MNRTVKRCLWGLVVSATMFGIARAQDEQPVGTTQIGPGPQPPVGSAQTPEITDVTLPDGTNVPPAQSPFAGNAGVPGGYFRTTPVDQAFTPRFNLSSYGGGLYGYNAGYMNLGAFVPYKLDDTALLFATGQGMVTYDGRGGANVGAGWRYWMEGIDRIVGLSAWFDFDNGHALPYQQLGLSFESLGRYSDLRINGYLPVSSPDHVLSTNLTSNSILMGNGIGLVRNSTIEQAYSGFDAEVGGPTPFLGRYGLNAYIGGYFFTGGGVNGGNFTGVSGRLLSQINEDVSFGVQVTNDHMFGLNTQFQVFANLPNGRPSRWLRNLTVKDRMFQNVFRQNRVIAKIDAVTTFDTAINPKTSQPYFVANINPNLTTNGNGSVTNPFNSIAAYEAQSVAQQKRYDIIYVAPRTDGTSTNLDTTSTLDIYNGQRLLSTTIPQTFLTANLPGTLMNLQGFTGGAAPLLFNSTGGDVITLVGGNTQCEQVSGFEILGSATGNGIRGNNNAFVNISNNNIHGGLNGVLLTNLSGTIAAGTEAIFNNNNIHDNLGNGIQVTNHGSPPFVPPLDVVVQNNIFNKNGSNGLQLDAQAGATIGGIIGGPNTPAVPATGTTPAIPAVNLSNIFSNNGANGLNITANGGTLLFQSPAIPVPGPAIPALFGVPNNAYGIYNNTFTNNALDGLHINTTNNSVSTFNIVNNAFGTALLTSSGNSRYGIGLISDSGTTTIDIGGAIVTNVDGTKTNPGNTFNFNVVDAINLAVSGTATLSYDINNNTISNGLSSTIPAPHDAFSFAFNGTSGIDPFTITNLSDPGVSITGVTWNLNGTNATFLGGIGGNGATASPIIQPINGSDLNTGLTTVDGVNVQVGSNPLLVSNTTNVANFTNLGVPQYSTSLALGFNNFIAQQKFQATGELQQSGGSSALTSASTVGSTVSVQFNNGLTSTQKVALTSSTGIGVAAAGDVFGASIPGFGTGGDGIHVIASGNSTLNTSIIHNNSVTGVGGYAINVETAGSASAPNIVIEKNNVTSNGTGVNGAGVAVFTGGGIDLSRSDSSTLHALVDNNIVTANFNNGLSLIASGTAVGGMSVNSHDNNFSNNGGNGSLINNSGAAVLTLNSVRDNFNGNGGGSAKNIAVTAGDNIAIITGGTSVSNLTFNNVLASNATGNGMSATSNGGSTLNLVVESLTDPLFNGQSLFTSNKQNGILLTSNDDSFMHANVFDSTLTNNVLNGLAYARTGASLVRSSIVDTNMSNNQANGFLFHGIGSDPQDPNQQFSGTPNRIIMINDSLTFNGNFATGVGQGARFDMLGDSGLVLNASATSFSNNAENGVRILIGPGAEFGFTKGNERSIFDNVAINQNGLNGIMVASTITPQGVGPTGVINPFFPPDAPSVTFMQVSANTGNTTINNNGANGVNLQYVGGNHDVLITGDLNPSTNFMTVIQANKNDGIHVESGDDGAGNGVGPGLAETTVTVGVNKVLIGGPLAVNANLGNGIDVETQSIMSIKDGANTSNFLFPESGEATLNVNASTIQNNGLNGINLLGDNLIGNGRTSNNVFTDGWGQLQANISNSFIIQNKGTGVNINLLGQMGESRIQGAFGPNNFVLTNNVISDNGKFGVFYEGNTAVNIRGGINPDFISLDFFDPQPTNPPSFFDFNNLGFFAPPGLFNSGNNTDLINGFLQSNWMNLTTNQNSNMVMTGNMIQFNGSQSNLQAADGVYIRVGTNSYLSADVRNNTVSGNLGNDFHFESFDAYNPATGVAPQPTGSVARAAPALDTVVLDDTAQLDLRFSGNIANTLNITDPMYNWTANGTLPGNTTPNGAVYGADGLKDNFSFANPSPRIVQLFQVDNGVNLNSLNNIGQGATVTDVQQAFFQSDWHLRLVADPLFPNPAFPQDFFTSPGNPFLP